MALDGRGLLPALDPGFRRFLDEQNTALAGENDVFNVKNAVLDERVSDGRAKDYQVSGAATSHADFVAWRGAHVRYILAHVALPWTGRLPPGRVTSPGSDCAETFGMRAGNDTELAEEEFLLRLVRFPTDAHVSDGYREFADALRRVAGNRHRAPQI